MFLHNYYRLKRKLQKRHARRFISVRSRDAAVGHRADVSWLSMKANPYYHSNTRLSFRVKLEFCILFFALGSTMGLLVYHPFFQINAITIYGNKRLALEDIRNRTVAYLHESRFLILPKKNYFIVNQKEVEEYLRNSFSLHTAAVEKKFPHALVVTIDEKLSTVIYDNGTRYFLLGMDGTPIEEIGAVGTEEPAHTPAVALLKKEVGEYPVVYDARNIKIDEDAPIPATLLDSSLVKGTLEWYIFLKTKTDIPFSYMRIENDLNVGIIKTGEGWEMRVFLTRDLEQQFAQLRAVLSKVNRKTLSHIDLRYGERVFWK